MVFVLLFLGWSLWGEGGLRAQCRLEVDVDGDGRKEVIRLEPSGKAAERGRLRVRTGGRVYTIDEDVTTRECYWLTILGRRGLVVLPHGQQVRFYAAPERWGGKWEPRDLYSFYTASWQGGLLQVDVDGDGRLDLICGNYWIQSPAEFDLPWRLYAINAYHEHPLSASAQLHWDGARLLWVESRRPRGRIVWFHPLEDPKQLWREEPHELSQQLDCPQMVLRGGRPVISASKRRCR